MEHQHSSGEVAGVRLFVGLNFHQAIDFDRKPLRRALVNGARVVRKEARTLVSRRVVSQPGEFPGQQTGAMRRAIGVIGKGDDLRFFKKARGYIAVFKEFGRQHFNRKRL